MILTRKEAKDISDMARCGQGPSELMRAIEHEARQGGTSLHGQAMSQRTIDGLISLGYDVISYNGGAFSILWGDDHFGN